MPLRHFFFFKEQTNTICAEVNIFHLIIEGTLDYGAGGQFQWRTVPVIYKLKELLDAPKRRVEEWSVKSEASADWSSGQQHPAAPDTPRSHAHTLPDFIFILDDIFHWQWAYLLPKQLNEWCLTATTATHAVSSCHRKESTGCSRARQRDNMGTLSFSIFPYYHHRRNKLTEM